MNKDNTEHTCNAHNKISRKIKCPTYHIKTEDVHTAIKLTAKKQSLYIVTKICVSMFIAYKIFFIVNVFHNFYIVYHSTPQRYVP